MPGSRPIFAARPGHSFRWSESDYRAFESGFPFDLTEDKASTLDAVLDDLVSDQPMVPEGVKTAASDKEVNDSFVELHLKLGIASLKQLINAGNTVKHLKF